MNNFSSLLSFQIQAMVSNNYVSGANYSTVLLIYNLLNDYIDKPLNNDIKI